MPAPEPQTLLYTPRAEMIERSRRSFRRSSSNWTKVAQDLEEAVRASQRIGSKDLAVCIDSTEWPA